MRLESKLAEATYQSHPEHLRVRDDVIKPALADGAAPVLAVDYVFELRESSMPWWSLVLIGASLGALGALAALRR